MCVCEESHVKERNATSGILRLWPSVMIARKKLRCSATSRGVVSSKHRTGTCTRGGVCVCVCVCVCVWLSAVPLCKQLLGAWVHALVVEFGHKRHLHHLRKPFLFRWRIELAPVAQKQKNKKQKQKPSPLQTQEACVSVCVRVCVKNLT